MSNGHVIPWLKNEKGPGAAAPFGGLHKQMDQLLESFFGGPPAAAGQFWPSIDVSEVGDELHVKAEVPGIEEKDLEASLGEDLFVLKGEKKREQEEKGEESYRLERSYGSFRREIPLPCKVQVDKVKATFKNGVLTVTVPKALEQTTRKKIDLKAK